MSGGAHCTAGFRVRFKTNSEFVAVKVKLVDPINLDYFSPTRMTADLYVDYNNSKRLAKSFSPLGDNTDVYERVVHFSNNNERCFTLHLPTYEKVQEVYVGLEDGATLNSGMEYEPVKPIVYYGGSITQGGICHRPGNTYQAIINRRNNIDFINLGFSGRGKAEPDVMEYIANLDMSVFVYDTLNATDIDFIKSIHERGYKIIREKNPDLPIIIMSNTLSLAHEHQDPHDFLYERRIVEMQTYINAYQSGDRNVYFIDGWQIFKFPEGDCCSTDGVHPSDYGFVRMADIIGEEIDTILRRKI